ncbi:MAG: hypothetical protein JKP96_13835 [Oceanicaulis sp.]|nr:hypothetical protein [Oceanicaulis sp.]
MPLPRLLMIGFGLVAIFGALLASGRLGEGGVQMAVGITLLVTGGITATSSPASR